MAAMQRRLVHKQFNSPINLYSQKNIQETLDRELKLLSNGAVGIDFDDPSTTKPPSLAKSAVLAALEEEEREKSRGTAVGRPSRSRHPARRTHEAAPSIDRETVLKINRRPLQRRHRSCDNFWPPRSPATGGPVHDRHHPSPSAVTDALPDADHGEFAIDSRRYGSHDSIHFDERIRRQHKIDPLRTLYDRENVVLTNWGQRPRSTPPAAPAGHQREDKNDNHVYGSAGTTTQVNAPCHTSAGQHDNRTALRDDDGECTAMLPATSRDTDWPAVHGNCVPGQNGGDCQRRKEVHPPEPPPRRYYLPMDKIASGELEAMLRLFQDTPITPEQQQHHRRLESPGRRSATPSHGGKMQLHERSHSVQGFERPSQQPAPATLLQDGIESKPPLKLKPCTGGRTTPRSALQRHPTVTDVSCIETIDQQQVDAVEANHEFNLNSNTGWNLNIDRRHEPSTSGQGKPPKQSYSCAASATPSVTCVSPVAETAVSIGADQLTTNYFDKQADPSTVRFPVASNWSSPDAPTDQRSTVPPRFPVTAITPISPPIERQQDHKFDSNVNCTGYHRCWPSVGEFHNYNEKLITDTADEGVVMAVTEGGGPLDTGSTPQPLDERQITENRCQSHSSALNVSNQPNRNWINLNSNQIYHQQQQQQWWPSPRDPVVCQRMSPGEPGGVGLADAYHRRAASVGPGERHGASGQLARETHVAYGTTSTTSTTAYNEHANDNLQRFWPVAAAAAGIAAAAGAEQHENYQLDCNYDNKSVRSHYRREASSSDNGQLPVEGPAPPPSAYRYVTPSPPLPPYPLAEEPLAPSVPWRPRARSGSSGSSVKINEIFEFPPPPPYPCDCAAGDMTATAGEEEEQDDELPEVCRSTNVNAAAAPTNTTPDDTGRDCSTSDRSNHRTSVNRSPAVNVAVAVNATTFPSTNPSHRDRCQPTVGSGAAGAGDNDVNAHPTRCPTRFGSGSPEPTSCSQRDDANPYRTVTGESFRSPTPPSVPASSNVDVDYFKTNLTADKPRDASANSRAHHHFDHRWAGAPRDKSIDPSPCHSGAENSAPARSERGTDAVDTPVRPARMISFTDGEFIFGPFDERTLEFGRFELLSDKRGQGAQTPAAPGRTGSTDESLENGAPGDAERCNLAHSPSGECQQSRTPSPPTDYTRWARFENGNISPRATTPSPGRDLTTNERQQSTPASGAPTTEPTRRQTRGEEIEHIFQQLNHSLKANAEDSEQSAATKATLGQLVENVPVIERILDDLLTFSKQLLEQKQLLQERQESASGGDAAAAQQEPGAPKRRAENRAMAPRVEINDDNLINLLASDSSGGEEGKEMTPAIDDHDTPERTHSEGESKKCRANNGANNGNQPVGGELPPQREDPFTSVAIFNWNPLDVYQQQGLFMIDPRFALADMRAISPGPPPGTSSQSALFPLPTVPEEMVDSVTDTENQTQRRTGQETGVAAPKTSDWKVNACHNYCPAGVDPTVAAGSSNRQSGDNVDKIVQMNQVLHCNEPDHVRCSPAAPPDSSQQRELTPTDEGTYH
uniref:Zasp-like motif domain-containing protein n=1 Tax=Anopheles quadriannulatus TaxID=34691 RepID=A0A182XMH4_ANOQN